MKEFQDLISELHNGVEDLAEHVNVPRSSMPPNILILRRKTVRQFPDGVMVALYYNDKLGLQFSIPYGGEPQSIVTPVALKESEELEEGRSLDIDGHLRAQWMAKFEKHVTAAKPEHAGKIDWNTASYLHGAGHKPEDAATLYHTRGRDRLEESVIDRLRNIKDFHSVNHITHADRTLTHVDPTTAHALLTVHDALKPEHQVKFAQHLYHSKAKFHKMLDFAWKQVK